MKPPLRNTLPLAIAMFCLAQPAAAQVRAYEAPTHGGHPIAYCGVDPSSCGEQVANAWCRSQGYERARDWAARPGVDATWTTVRLDDAHICHGRQCDAFAAITCAREAQTFTMPRLGAAGLATVIAPDRRDAAVAIDESQLSMIIPGCHQRQPGVYLCETAHEYQHCRTLLRAGKIFSCRAALAFDGDFASPYAAAPDQYLLEVESDAEIRIEPGRRGEGRVRGEAVAKIQFMPPVVDQGIWCLQRDQYVYHYTGPLGGIGEISDTQDCDQPIEVVLKPHADHVLMAYDACASFAAWGSELDEEMDILVSALFQIGSASPKFLQEHGASTAIIAPYAIVTAPVRVDCRD